MTLAEILDAMGKVIVDSEALAVAKSFPTPIGLSADIFIGKNRIR